MYFVYGEKELTYLRRKDRRLSAAIDRIGHVDRAVDTDLFSSVVHHIVGQQISTKAQATIWQRMQDALGTVNADTVLAAGVPQLQALGMTFRKAEYITDFAAKVQSGAFDIDAVAHMSDADAIRALSALKGIGEAAQQALTAAYGSDWANYGGKLTTLGAAEGAVGLPTDTWSLKNWTVDQYKAMFEKIVKGEISIDNDFSKLASTDHVTLNLVK